MLPFSRSNGIHVTTRMPRRLVYLARDPPRYEPAPRAANRDGVKDRASRGCLSA